jgi:M6 family metalloprotease-like protein
MEKKHLLIIASLLVFSGPTSVYGHEADQVQTSPHSPIEYILNFLGGTFSSKNLAAQVLQTPTPTPLPVSQPAAPTPPPPTDVIESETVQILGASDFLTKYGTSLGIQSLLADPNNVLTQSVLENQAVAVATKRKDLLVDIARKAPTRFFGLTISDASRSQLIPAVQTSVEKRGITSGELTVMHIDNFIDPTKSEFNLSLNTSGNKYEILSPVQLGAHAGGTAKVSGFALGPIIMLDGGDNSIVPIAAQGIEALGDQRLLVLITEMQGEASPITIDDANQVIFSPNSLFQTYYRNQSYGKVQFVGKVYKISLNRPPSSSSCGSFVYINDPDVSRALQAQQVDLSLYDRVLFLPPIGYCSMVGKVNYTISGKTYRLSESWVGYGAIRSDILYPDRIDTTLAHELGHALGVMHANFLLCDSSDPGKCQHQEYGNYFDIMGSGIGDFNAYYKEQLGWLTATDFTNITSTGQYSVLPLESLSGKRAVKIVNPAIGAKSVIYVEKRNNISDSYRSYANDQNNQLLLNVPQHPAAITYSNVELMDMSPGFPTSNDKNNVTLVSDKSFNLDSYGVTIGPVLAQSSAQSTIFNVSIHSPNCASIVPRIIPQDYIPTVVQTGLLFINVTAYNQDPLCSQDSSYTVTFDQLPPGLKIDDSALTSGNLSPRNYAYFWTRIHVSADANIQTYTLPFSVKNNRTGQLAKGEYSFQVKPILKILSVDPPGRVQVGSKLIIQTNHTSLSGFDGPVAFSLRFGGPDLFTFKGTINLDGKITVTIPSSLDYQNSWCIDQGLVNCPRLTPTGNYSMILDTYSSSDPYQIKVVNSSYKAPSITFSPIALEPYPTALPSPNPEPNLRLVYDSRKNESDLVANFSVYVNAGNEDIGIPKSNAFYVYATDGLHHVDGRTEYSKPANVNESADGVAFILKAGSSINFNVKSHFYPANMFGGAYYASLDGVGLASYLKAPANKTNTVVIVGEKSPYINFVSPATVRSDEILTITGVKFNTTDFNIVNFYPSNPNPLNGTRQLKARSVDGLTIKVVTNLPADRYSLQVINPLTGASNFASVIVYTPPAPSTSPTPSSSPQPVEKSSQPALAPIAPAAQYLISPSTSPYSSPTPTSSVSPSPTYSPSPTVYTSPSPSSSPSPSTSPKSTYGASVWQGMFDMFQKLF